MIADHQLVQISRVGGRADRGVVTDPYVAGLLATDVPVAVGVSGGKDSTVCAAATIEHLDAIGHRGSRILVHSDLGRVEWRESLPVCERLAKRYGVELLVVRRQAGDMLDRWLTRWANNVARYVDLRCVKLILPWSTPSMRFCTSELKTAVICRALTARFPGKTIISASGIRRAESSARAKAPISATQAKLSSKTNRTVGVDWHPILEWSHADVFSFIAERDLELHEAYLRYHMSRVSCAFCIMSSASDLRAAAGCEDNAAVYRDMVDLEIVSTFAFQGTRWLGDVAPDLLSAAQLAGLARAKAAAERRVAIEARIPKHLLFEKGWPKVMPTESEAELLCECRRDVASEVGLVVKYTEPVQLRDRYAELMAMNAARGAR